MTIAWQTAELRVYDRDGSTLRSTVSATGVRWVDELKSEGAANYTVPWLQAALTTDPDLLRDAIVKVAVPLTSGGALTEVFAWLSTPGQGTLVAEGEDAAKQETPACRGIRALIDDWVLLHDGGFSTFGGTTRYFGWMSRAYDDSGWSTPISRRWDADTNPSRAGFPAIFGTLDPAAGWISLTDPSTDLEPDGTTYYFRGQFTNLTERPLRVYAAGDNYLDLYVNGEPVYLAGDAADAYGWKDVQEPWQRVFAAGEVITFAAKVRNAALTMGSNPVAFIMSVVSLDANGDPASVVFRTNAANFVVTDTVEGLTAAKILLTCDDEAATRGVTSAGLFTPSFTDTTDTASVAWPDSQELGWEIGTKGSQIVSDLEAMAFDLHMRPDLGLDAYVSRGTDRHTTVALTKGVNLLSYSYDGQPLTATRLLVRVSDRWLYLTDSAAETTYSPREGYLESGLSLSPDQGTSVGEANLDDMARETYAYTAVIVCHDGAGSVSPYHDFDLGDLVNAYNYRMERATLQVVSISSEVPEDGIVRWTIELREP